LVAEITTGSDPAELTRVSMNIPESKLERGMLALRSHFVLFRAANEVL